MFKVDNTQNSVHIATIRNDFSYAQFSALIKIWLLTEAKFIFRARQTTRWSLNEFSIEKQAVTILLLRDRRALVQWISHSTHVILNEQIECFRIERQNVEFSMEILWCEVTVSQI